MLEWLESVELEVVSELITAAVLAVLGYIFHKTGKSHHKIMEHHAERVIQLLERLEENTRKAD